MLFIRYFVAYGHKNALGFVGAILVPLGLGAAVRVAVEREGSFGLALTLGMALVGVAMLLGPVRRTCRQLRVLRSGTAVLARIDSVSEHREFTRGTAGRSRQTLVVFHYPGPDGVERRSSTTIDGAPHRWSGRLAQVLAVHDPSAPEDVVLDLFHARRGGP